MYFTRPPVIHNTGTKRGIYVQGSLEGINEDDKNTFMEVIEGFQDLVKPGQKLTGLQWISVITREMGEIALRRPNALSFLEVVRRVMLTSHFGDDYALVDPKGGLAWRGSKGACIDKQYEIADLESDDLQKWQTVAIKDIDPSDISELDLKMAREHADSLGLSDLSNANRQRLPSEFLFASNFYNIDPSYKAYANQTNSTDAKQDQREGVRALEMLNSRSPTTVPDLKATSLLIQMLCNSFGFNSLVYDEAGQPTEYMLTEVNEVIHTPEQAEEKLIQWARISSELPLKTTVHICRPASISNLSGVREPYETLVSRKKVGWRIPNACWNEYYNQVNE
jgi:hypothetical protein